MQVFGVVANDIQSAAFLRTIRAKGRNNDVAANAANGCLTAANYAAAARTTPSVLIALLLSALAITALSTLISNRLVRPKSM